MITRRAVSGTLGFSGLFLSFLAGTAPATSHEFLWLSDVHFDPTVNASLVDKLAAADVSEWAQILNSAPGAPSKFGQDTNWPLFASAILGMKKAASHAQFIVVTGDVFGHKLRERFNDSATDHDDEAFQRFTTKTFDFVAAQLESIAPGRPVLFTLGNNDGECGDYKLQPYGPFLRSTSATITRMLGAVGDKDSEVDWADAGNYDVANPALPRARIIALNSVFLSAKYQNTCGASGDSEPATDQLRWLASRLAQAKSRNENVWLIFHIPPGIDGYATSHPKGGGEKTIVPMWSPAYTQQFEDLLQQYPDTVTISLAGHEHTDDFRLIDHSLVLLAPALSPVVEQNPAFRMVQFDADVTLKNATTYYLSNLDEFDTGTEALWKPEYNFVQAWGMGKLDFPHFEKLNHDIETNPERRAQWEKLYTVSHPEGNGITNQTFPWIFCAAANMSDTVFHACVQRVQAH